MDSVLDNIQPAVKKETKRIAVMTAVGVILMWLVFAVLHMINSERFPLGYAVFLGGLGGGTVAVLNFLLMGIAVQKVVSAPDEETARMQMKASYSRRMMIQMLWVIAAIALPCFHFIAGSVPLLFPSVGIKILGILNK